MSVSIEPPIAQDDDLRIRLTGELDLGSAPALTQALTAVRPPSAAPGDCRRQVVLDLQDLTFMDTSGLTALDGARNTLDAAGWHVSVGPAQRQVRRLLRFAQRSGWLVNGPLTADDTARSHITPCAKE